MGQVAIARWMMTSDRTCRRARAALEEAGLITSYLLLPGEMLPGQKRPVKRPQVVRDVSRLHRLVNVRSGEPKTPRRGKRSTQRRRGGSSQNPPSASALSSSALVTADDFDALAELSPEFAPYFVAMAAATREGPPEPPATPKPPRPSKPAIAEPPTPEELDAIDVELDGADELERGPP